MIIASQKPLSEIMDSLAPFNNILIAACGTCVTVCLSGGEKEAAELAALLSLNSSKHFKVIAPERQCDSEFLQNFDDDVIWADAVLSLACGVGVQFMGERYENFKIPVIPGLNTSFLGANRDAGYWTEMCQGCGNCVLDKTGGVCPVARCSKSHFNGPCGGSANGKCEINPNTDCAWQLIFNRLSALGQIDKLYDTIPPRDWSSSRDGGPRTLVRSDVAIKGE